MKLLSVIALGLTLIGGSALAHSGGTNSKGCHTDHSNNSYHCHQQSNVKLNININIGKNTAHGNVCRIQQTNVSGLLDQTISYGFKHNGDVWMDDGTYHVFSNRMVIRKGSSRVAINHNNGSVLIDTVQDWLKVTWKSGGKERYIKAVCNR